MYTKDPRKHANEVSSFQIIDPYNNGQNMMLKIKDAAIKWAHFTKDPKFGRSMTIVLADDVALDLRAIGCYIKEGETPDGDIEYRMDIAIGDREEKYCPSIVMYSEFNGKRTATTLGFMDDVERDVANMSRLDSGIYEHIDVVVNLREKAEPDRYGSRKGYLKQLKCILKPQYSYLDDDDYYDQYMAEMQENLPFA